MSDISYTALTRENFSSLDGFIRRQPGSEIWQKIGGEYRLVKLDFVMDWDKETFGEVTKEILGAIDSGSGTAFGAFTDGKLAGFALVSRELFGGENKYAELNLIQVSEPYRHMGMGRELFALACGAAKGFGAKKLYVSACPSRETVAFYRSMGCVDAVPPDPVRAEREPDDLQLERVL